MVNKKLSIAVLEEQVKELRNEVKDLQVWNQVLDRGMVSVENISKYTKWTFELAMGAVIGIVASVVVGALV